MSEKLIWGGNSKQLHKINGSNTYEEIPLGIYELILTMQGAYLEKVSDNFEFNYKLYGVEEKFIDHTMKSFNTLTKNMGVLLCGLKGTGKTVTAKQLANLSGLPVILLNANSIGALSYFNDIPQPLCFFFDEFEKIIRQDDSSRMAEVLSFVDGTITTQKHLMLFTSNTIKVNEYFIDRPGRIRYIKKFNSLSLEVVKEIVGDKLNNKEHAKDLIEWVIYFKFLTIDLLTSIIDEINIHDMSVKEFKDFFNADNEKTPYSISFKITDSVTGKIGEFTTPVIIKDGSSPSEVKEAYINGYRDLQITCLTGKLYESESGVFDKFITADVFASSYYLGEEIQDGTNPDDLIFTSFIHNDSEEEDVIKIDDDGRRYIFAISDADKTVFIRDGIRHVFEMKVERDSLYGGYTYSL